MQIVTEKAQSAHWYSLDGKPQHTVMGKSTGKPRPTNVTDARKNGWVPSVTTILKCLHKPALERWKIGQAVMACMTAPRKEGETLDVFIDRVLNVEMQQDQEAAAARDLGSDIHAALETVLKGGQCSEELAVYVGPALELIQGLQKQHGVKVVATEQVLVGDGYAGTTDLILGNPEVEIVLDFKCSKSVPKTEPWSEHQLQLSAYAATRKSCVESTFNLYISTTEPGKAVLLPSGDWRDLYANEFKPLLQYWRHANGF